MAESETPSVHAELIQHLESIGWAADEHGDAVCADQGAAMAAEAIRSLERELHLKDQKLAELERRKDAAYLERNQVVAALAKCFPSGIARTAIEGWSEDWHGCVYIELPTGQASWHFHDSHAPLFDGLPQYDWKWDGHATDEKYRRLAALRAESLQSQLAAAQEALRKIANTAKHDVEQYKLPYAAWDFFHNIEWYAEIAAVQSGEQP